MPDRLLQPSTLSREQLYEKVWSAPATRLAEELGVSDVAIAKACRRHQIPKPPAGHWARLAAGQSSPRPPLPVRVNPGLQRITFRPPLPREVAESAESPETRPTFDDERLAAVHRSLVDARLDWTVPAEPADPLAIVSDTLAALRRSMKNPSRYGRRDRALLVEPAHDQDTLLLDVCVGPQSVDRAIAFMDALLKILLPAGFKITQSIPPDGHQTLFEILGLRRQVRLLEVTKRRPHVSTPEEIRELARSSWRTPEKWDYVPTGVLRVVIAGPGSKMEHRSWADGRGRRIEQMLREVVEEAAAQRERERRREEEQARMRALIQEVEDWETAMRIRRYLHALRRGEAQRSGGRGTDDPPGWLEWAASVADRLDPPHRSA